ncbi:MAG: multidrug ABC transporter ATP-binding protein [Pirellula sp.]|nr:multidrug ABC transporter ATP-binding protein [Pirellula sp.]
MIELQNFSKRYGDFTAVENLTLRIGPGELFGFIGPNGAGKSTTIRFLVTLLKATSGQGFVAGFSVGRQPMDVRRSIGYMPDAFGVYDGMKVWEFLDFFAAAYQIPHARRRTIINDVMELLDIGGKRDEQVSSLSRGMTQRLCLAKTLVHDPPVLILDEPTSGLDPRARLEIKALLRELRNMGKTILIASHILTELADCCTSIGILERGKLLLHGPIDDVYRRIQSNRRVEIRFVAVQESNNQQRGIAILRRQPGFVDLQIDGPKVTAEIAADEAALATIVDEFAAEGVRFHSFADLDPTLEDVFMLVTKGAVN